MTHRVTHLIRTFPPFFPLKKLLPYKRKNCPSPPPHPLPLFSHRHDRVTASRLRRLRVLLTGRHGNLATSLQWPKVDGLRAGAPEQTEEKSVHARTRNRTCTFVRLTHARSLLSFSFSLLLFLSLYRAVLTLLLFSRSRRDSPRVRVHGVCGLASSLQTTGREAVVSR